MGFWEVSPSLDNIWECVSLDGSSWLATIWCFSDLCNLSRRGQIHSRQSKYQELYALTVWTYAKNCVELGHPNVMPYMRLFALSLHVLELHVFILVANDWPSLRFNLHQRSLGPLGCVQQPWTLQALVRRRDDLGQLLQAQMPRGLGVPRIKRGFLHQEHMLKNIFQS